jgi:hypothetical protein
LRIGNRKTKYSVLNDREHFLNLILSYFHKERPRISVTYKTPPVGKLAAPHSTDFSFYSGVGFIKYIMMINKQHRTFLKQSEYVRAIMNEV